MPRQGAHVLSDLFGRLDMLEIACRRCERSGRLNVARLVDEHGPGLTLPELRRVVAADCPGWKATAIHERCGVMFPDLPAVFGKPAAG